METGTESCAPGLRSRGPCRFGCGWQQLGGAEILGEVRSDDHPLENLPGSFEIPLHQQRGNVKRLAVGIETGAAGAIHRKELGDVVIDAEQIPNRIVIFAPVQPPNGHGARKISGVAGSSAEVLIDPERDLEAVVLSQFGIDGRHGAVTQLGGNIAPEAAVGLDILSGGGFEEIDALFRVGRVVAGRAILRQDGSNGLRKLVGWRLLWGRCRRGEQDSARQ